MNSVNNNPISRVFLSIVKTEEHTIPIGQFWISVRDLERLDHDIHFDLESEIDSCEYLSEDGECCGACVTECYLLYRSLVDLPEDEILTLSEWSIASNNNSVFLKEEDENYIPKNELLNIK